MRDWLYHAVVVVVDGSLLFCDKTSAKQDVCWDVLSFKLPHQLLRPVSPVEASRNGQFCDLTTNIRKMSKTVRRYCYERSFI